MVSEVPVASLENAEHREPGQNDGALSAANALAMPSADMEEDASIRDGSGDRRGWDFGTALGIPRATAAAALA